MLKNPLAQINYMLTAPLAPALPGGSRVSPIPGPVFCIPGPGWLNWLYFPRSGVRLPRKISIGGPQDLLIGRNAAASARPRNGEGEAPHFPAGRK